MLSKNQIEYLFRFCEKHLVKNYDVQVELADHLANAVEEKMSSNKVLTFDEALENVYKGFGVMGFARVVSSKASEVERRAINKYLSLLKQQITWPKIMSTLLITAIAYTLFIVLPDYIFYIFWGILFVLLIVLVTNSYSFYRFIKKSGKRLSIQTPFYVTNFILLPIYFNSYSNYFFREGSGLSADNIIILIVLSVVLAFYFISTVIIIRLTKEVKQDMVENYPEVFQITD